MLGEEVAGGWSALVVAFEAEIDDFFEILGVELRDGHISIEGNGFVYFPRIIFRISDA